MGMVIVGLLKDAHQARGVIRALDDAGFSGDDIDMSGGLLSQLVARGLPDETRMRSPKACAAAGPSSACVPTTRRKPPKRPS